MTSTRRYSTLYNISVGIVRISLVIFPRSSDDLVVRLELPRRHRTVGTREVNGNGKPRRLPQWQNGKTNFTPTRRWYSEIVTFCKNRIFENPGFSDAASQWDPKRSISVDEPRVREFSRIVIWNRKKCYRSPRVTLYFTRVYADTSPRRRGPLGRRTRMR